MAHRRRVHLEGGVYWVRQMAAAGAALFPSAEDYTAFEDLLAAALSRTHAHALAYCWLPTSIHLVMRVERIPVGRVLQGFMSHYARWVHDRTGARGHLFADRYRSVLIEPEQWLFPVIRYLHHLPVMNGLAMNIEDYPQSSHADYLDLRHTPWLDLSVARRIFQSDAISYETLIARPLPRAEREAIELAHDTGVLGGENFLRSVPRALRPKHPATSLDDLIRAVIALTGVERAELFSKARRQELTLARALIAWHARERGIATLTHVAARLGRDPSTLSSSITRYQSKRPDLFDPSVLRYLQPLAKREPP